MPRMIRRRDLSAFKKYYFAHRGLHGDSGMYPENSLAAFDLAVEQNYAIELDVQLTKDKEPVVFHDYSLERVCGIDKKVYDTSWEEMRGYKLYDSNEGIPHLAQVLDLVDGRVPLLIELKMETKDIALCEVVAPYLDRYQGRYCIESFNPLGLLWFRKNRPAMIRGQLSTDFVQEGEKGDRRLYFALKHLLLNFLGKPDFIAYHEKYRKTLSYLLCRRLFKPPSFAWTIASQEALASARKDFDIFIFEHFIPK